MRFEGWTVTALSFCMIVSILVRSDICIYMMAIYLTYIKRSAIIVPIRMPS